MLPDFSVCLRGWRSIAWPGKLSVLVETFFIDVNDDRNRRGFSLVCGQQEVVKSIMKKVGHGGLDKI